MFSSVARRNIFNNHLSTISGIRFTFREIEVMACILHNRGDKKIASILSVSPRTVSTHVYNIMSKLRVNSKDAIIDFVNTSGKIVIIKEYYHKLLIESAFENHLLKIGKLYNKDNIILELMTNDNGNLEEILIIHHLKDHLQLANIILDLRTTNIEDSDAIFNIATYHLNQPINLVIGSSKYKLCNKTVQEIELTQESYYDSVLKLIRVVCNNREVDALCDAFKQDYNNLLRNNGTFKNNIHHINGRDTASKSKKYVIFAFLVFMVFTGIFCYYNYSRYDTKHKANMPLVNHRTNPVNYFVGRSDLLQDINKQLNLFGAVNIVGISGIGKTQLVRKFAEDYYDNYDIIYIFDSSTNIREQFVLLAKEINNNICKESQCIKLLEELEYAQESVMEFLSTRSRWLLIFDNIRIGNQPPLDKIVKWDHGGHVIFASQDTRDFASVVMHVNPLNQDESSALIEAVMNCDNPQDKKTMQDITDGYPLFIVKSAAIMNNKLVKGVTEKCHELFESKDTNLTSYIKIVIDSLSPETQELLYKIALLNNQSFAKDVLSIIIDDTADLDNSLQKLVDFSLIDITETSNYEMHDLIANAIQSLCQDHMKKYTEEILDKIPAWLQSQEQGGHFMDSYISIESYNLQNHLEVILNNARKFNANYQKLLECHQYLLFYYIFRDDNDKIAPAIEWFEEDESKFFPQNAGLNGHQKALYATYLAGAGHYYDRIKHDQQRAINLLNKAESLLHNLDHYKSYVTARMIHFYLAILHLWRGELAQAERYIALIHQDTDIIISKYGKSQYKEKVLCLDGALGAMNGQFEKGLECIDEMITAISNTNPLSVDLLDYICKARLLNNLKRFQEAYDVVKPIYDQHISDQSPKMITLLRELATAELGLGDLTKAKSHILQSEELYNRYYANQMHNNYASIIIVKADILVAMNNKKEALKIYEYALQIYYEVFKENFCNIHHAKDTLMKVMRFACLNKNKTKYYEYLEQFSKCYKPSDLEYIDMENQCAIYKKT